MIYSGSDPPNRDRPARGYGGENREKCVDHVVLAHENSREEVGHDDFPERGRLYAFNSCPDEDDEVGKEDHTKNAAIEVSNLVAKVAYDAPLRLLR